MRVDIVQNLFLDVFSEDVDSDVIDVPVGLARILELAESGQSFGSFGPVRPVISVAVIDD